MFASLILLKLNTNKKNENKQKYQNRPIGHRRVRLHFLCSDEERHFRCTIDKLLTKFNYIFCAKIIQNLVQAFFQGFKTSVGIKRQPPVFYETPQNLDQIQFW